MARGSAPKLLRALRRLISSGSARVTTVPRVAAPARRKKPARRPRDFQRARVYAWEAVHVMPGDTELLDLETCRALVEAAYLWHAAHPCPLLPDAAAGKPAPLVTDGRGRRHAAGSREVIKLPRWARTRPVVLHECAHGMAADGHGPDFMLAYLRLLEAFLGLATADLMPSLHQAKLKVSQIEPGGAFAAEARRRAGGSAASR